LDAPCSSERHVLGSPVHLGQWSPSRSKRLAVQQFAMLAAALDAVKPGGLIIYSTCSIAPQENDDIIARLHKKRAGLFETVPPGNDYGEPTAYGRQVFPDSCNGAGPLYFAKVRKN
ncbi:MAG: RsmB/NOP family class I SAM-dependent RNA methyltransferase, partial [Spirochaetales bacterium]|nr:RsmB/NOP family class I SAM-dependent RNA methyltransferase [Spirochaetales bacterium]